MSLDSKKSLVISIIDFLQTSISDGTVSADDKDSVEVAVQCLSDVFNVDTTQKQDVLGQQSLLSIFQAFEKVRDRSASSSSPSSADASASSASASAAAATADDAVSEQDKAKAEVFKADGNRAVASRDYLAAIESYTKAIALNPTNKIYYSNRAAAYSANQQHDLAVTDAEKALEIDSNYAKAYSRLGLAKFALGDAEGSLKAYKDGIEVEGGEGSEIMRKGYQTAKARVEEDARLAVPAATEDSTPSSRGDARTGGGLPDLSALGNLFGGAGSGAGAGGNGGSGGFDFASLMNNPMFSQISQQLSQNPDMLSGLMNNPAVRNMAERFTNGGSLPSLDEIQNNPDVANLARRFMGGNQNGSN
ncbi:hypothetical protein V1514DRAFT_169487 [Lipomyces japonicus]|uniref:uncharacterized protein n=1 Tax=Lipomyces japonicus TaxID=56871 RepID=UPI0034CF3788